MANETVPTLSSAIPSLELFMTKWESLAEKHTNLRPFIEAGLIKAREYYKRMDDTRAYVLALGQSISIVLCCFADELGSTSSQPNDQDELDKEELGIQICENGGADSQGRGQYLFPPQSGIYSPMAIDAPVS